MTDHLIVDGTAEDGTYQGDGELPPFVIYNVDKQENLPGYYPTRQNANLALQLEMARRALTYDAQQDLDDED